MSKVTIVVSDVDLDTGEYNIDLTAEGYHIDQNIGTAAYFTGYYLYTQVNTEAFNDGIAAYAANLMEEIDRACGPLLSCPYPVKATFEIFDLDYDRGMVGTYLDFEGQNDGNDYLPTTAAIVASYMRHLVLDMKFQTQVWDYAKEVTAEDKVPQLMNVEPHQNDDDDEAASAA